MSQIMRIPGYLAGLALAGISNLAMGATAPQERTRLEQAFREGRMSAKRDHGKTKSRYMPHQGQRECARRIRQMAGFIQ